LCCANADTTTTRRGAGAAPRTRRWPTTTQTETSSWATRERVSRDYMQNVLGSGAKALSQRQRFSRICGKNKDGAGRERRIYEGRVGGRGEATKRSSGTRGSDGFHRNVVVDDFENISTRGSDKRKFLLEGVNDGIQNRLREFKKNNSNSNQKLKLL
jgi:hypothetical protein